jgi:hypothetical protein
MAAERSAASTTEREENQMSIVGKWTFHYSWGCNGTYIQDEVTFNANGTFADSQGHGGNWSEDPGMMELQYTPPIRTTYAGNVQGNAMVGISSTFEGLQGCWYAVKEGIQIFTAAQKKATHNLAGTKHK